jgi:4-amino-4-deoxy-L-arabinose transferase-like glycosyltransferase
MFVKSRTMRLAIYAAVALMLYCIGLGRPALWEPDEGRYAEIPREMVVSGDYVTPHNNYVRYFEKPPLTYWASAAAIKIFGAHEFAVRLQAAITSAGSVIVTALLAEMIFGPGAGLFSAIVLALSPLFFIFARFATPDPALAFFLTAAMACFYAGAVTGDFAIGRGRLLMIVSAVLMGLATMVKGPVALVLGGSIALIWLMVEQRARDALRIRWFECIAAYLLIVLPWFGIVAAQNPGFLHFYVVHEHLERFLINEEHGFGPWFFIPIVIVGMWPFIFFIPSGIKLLWRDINQPNRRALRFLLIWFAVVFVFFSIPRSKLGEYILPGLPPLAILAGASLDWLGSAEPRAVRRLLGWLALVSVAAMVAGVPVLVLAIMGKTLESVSRTALDTIAVDAFWLLILQAIGIACVYLLARFLKSRVLPARALCAVALLVALILGKARNDATPLWSYRHLAQAISPAAKKGCALISYHHFVQALPFYTGTRERLVGYRGELAPFADGPDEKLAFIATDARLRDLWARSSCVVLIANRSDLARLEGLLSPGPRIIAEQGKKLAVTNRLTAGTSTNLAQGGAGR